MKDCKPAATLCPKDFVFTKKDCPTTDAERAELASDQKWYRSILASCIYLVSWTRPDIAFTVSKLSKFMQNPGKEHIKALRRLICYLKASLLYCLLYDFSTPPARNDSHGYSDAAHLDDVDTLRSTMAYIFFYKCCLISWKTKLHTYVTTSSNHSEYVATAKAAREAKWLHKIYKQLGFDQFSTIPLFCDNKGAVAMNYNPVNHERNKHVDMADHYAREQVERGIITITYVPTDQQLADFLTKALAGPKFRGFIAQLMHGHPIKD